MHTAAVAFGVMVALVELYQRLQRVQWQDGK